jgi:hypothetical protein
VYGFYTQPAFDWRVDKIEGFYETPSEKWPMCAIVTFSEELRGDGLQDPQTGAWPRQTSQVCIDIEGPKRNDLFKAQVHALTPREIEILGYVR